MLKLEVNNRRSIREELNVFRNLAGWGSITLPFGYALLILLRIRFPYILFFLCYFNIPALHKSHKSKNHTISPSKNPEIPADSLTVSPSTSFSTTTATSESYCQQARLHKQHKTQTLKPLMKQVCLSVLAPFSLIFPVPQQLVFSQP